MGELAVAALAEAPPRERPRLRLVSDAAEVTEILEAPVDPADRLINVDTIPQLWAIRTAAYIEARRRVEANRQLVDDGHADQAPVAVDPLGTARLKAEAKRRYGANSPQHRNLGQALFTDYSRLIGEAERNLTYEWFLPTKQKRDPVTENYTANGIPLLEITNRGLTPFGKPEEIEYRVNDQAGEVTNHAVPEIRKIGELALIKEISLQSIQECSDWALEAFKEKLPISYGGYAPAIKKLKIEDFTFDEFNEREHEVLYVSGEYINHEVILRTFKKLGGLRAEENPDKTTLHGMKFISTNGKRTMGLMQALDETASEIWGVNIFLGEVVPDDFVKDYSKIKVEAAARQTAREPLTHELVEYVEDLEAKGTKEWAAETYIKKRLKQIFWEITKDDPEKAAFIFGRETSEGLTKVAQLEQEGKADEAAALMMEVEKNAPNVEFCGAGSCGLDFVDPMSPEHDMAREAGLEGEILHNTTASCGGCGNMTLYHGENGMVCISCGKSNVSSKKDKSK